MKTMDINDGALTGAYTMNSSSHLLFVFGLLRWDIIPLQKVSVILQYTYITINIPPSFTYCNFVLYGFLLYEKI